MTEAESVSLSLWTADLEPGEPREDVQRAPPSQGAYDANTRSSARGVWEKSTKRAICASAGASRSRS